jgi:PilZ domain
MEATMNKRKYPRFVKRLQIKFNADHFSFTGISSDVSENGIFIRTNKGLSPNTIIDIEMIMPDNKISKLKGIVMRTIKTPFSSIKNGMGVQLLEKDVTFLNLINSLYTGERTEASVSG